MQNQGPRSRDRETIQRLEKANNELRLANFRETNEKNKKIASLLRKVEDTEARERELKRDLEMKERTFGLAILRAKVSVAQELTEILDIIKELDEKLEKTTKASEKLIEAIQSRINCAICLYPCRHAIMFSCGHLFCKECTQALQDGPAERRKCPNCRVPFEQLGHFVPYLWQEMVEAVLPCLPAATGTNRGLGGEETEEEMTEDTEGELHAQRQIDPMEFYVHV